MNDPTDGLCQSCDEDCRRKTMQRHKFTYRSRRKCAFPECDVCMFSAMVMCRYHWNMVPEHLQVKVLFMWARAGGNVNSTSAEYRAAIAEATEAAVEREKVVAANE